MQIIKKSILLIAASLFVVNIMAHGDDKLNQGQNYCAKLKDGVIVVLYQDNPITTDVMLDNGSAIKPDGTIITKDGNKLTLKDGQCVDKSGAIPVKENKQINIK